MTPVPADGLAPATATPLARTVPPELRTVAGTWWGKLLLALFVLVAGYLLTTVAVRYLGRPIARRFRRPSVTRTILRSMRVLGLVAAALVALRVVGFRLGNIVLSVTVFSAVLGLVLAPIVGSVVNGLFVLADQPYEVGDMIELSDTAGGTRGFVEDITLRYTKIFTLDNTFLVIPNSTMRERDVVNYSAEDERIRLSLELLVTYESDVEKARTLVERAARDVETVISGGPDIRIGSARYPAGPTCYIDEYADHGVLLTLRYWAKQPYKQLTVRSQVGERIWDALEDEPDVEVAYPHQHLVFDETSGQAQVRVEHGGGPGRGDKRPGRGGEGSGRGGTGPDGGGRGPGRDVPEDADSGPVDGADSASGEGVGPGTDTASGDDAGSESGDDSGGASE